MGFGYEQVNYHSLARPLDFVAWDNYPRTQWSPQLELDPSRAAYRRIPCAGLSG